MRRTKSLVAALTLILGWVIAAGPASGGQPDPPPRSESKTQAVFPAPPQSLSAYYPPVAATAIYTRRMLDLGRLMGTAFQEVYAANPDAAASLVAFGAEYEALSALVPEWKADFPAGPIEDLEKAVQAKAPDADLRRLALEVERVCTRCHVNEMPRVQALYDWPAFDRLTVRTSGNKSVSFHEIMVNLSVLLAGLQGSAEKKNFEQAAASYAGVRREFENLESACGQCHEEPREYFVDKRIKGRLLMLGGLVQKKEEDAAQYRREVDEIYKRSCIPCHQIHMPPAFTQILLKSQGGQAP